MSRPWTKLPTPLHTRLYFDALAIISPRRAAVAWHFDRMDRDPTYRESVHLGMRAMGYSMQGGPNKAAWPNMAGTPRSADAEVIQDLEKMRERVRVLGRIDPVGSGITRKFVLEMVGAGVHDRANTGDTAKDAAINEEWEERRKNLFPAEFIDWFGAQYMVAERLMEDGEVWERAVKRSGGDPLTFELVEGDRVDSPMDVLRVLPHLWQVRDGIERDANDRIKAYWIAKWHPGDTAIPKLFTDRLPVMPLSIKDYDRVTPDAAKHVRLPGRPGQSRSVSFLKSVVQNLRDMDVCTEAMLMRTQVAACFAAFIETAADIPDLVEATQRKYHYQLDQDLVPGMLFVLRPGEKISTLNPNFPAPDMKVVQEVLARRIGAALNISWRVVLSDVADANFSGARADQIELSESASVPRKIVIDSFRWMRRLVLEDALLMGSERLVSAGVTVEDLDKVVFLKRRKPWLDPRNQADGASIALKTGLMNERDYFSEEGKDWQEHKLQCLAEEEFERDERAKRGLGGDSKDTVGPQWVTVLQEILVSVTSGQLAPESAVALIQVSCPKVTEEQAKQMVEPAAALAAKKDNEDDQGDGDGQDDGDAGEPPAPEKPRHVNRLNGAGAKGAFHG